MSYIYRYIPRPTDSLTLAEVGECLRRDSSLDRHRRDDMLSALNTAATVLERRLADIPADPALLGRRLTEAAPAKYGVRRPRWNNVRSLVSAALGHMMPVLPGRQTRTLDPAWQALLDQLRERYAGIRITSFMHFCSAQGIPPDEVNQSTFEAFEKALAASLRKHPGCCYGHSVNTWNKAGETIPGWPAFRAVRLSRQETWTLPWSEFPLLLGDKDVWLAGLSGKDPMADKTLRPRTLKSMDYMLRESASALALQGWDPAAYSEVEDFGTLEAFKAVLRFMIKRQGRTAGAHIPSVAWMLKGIARHMTRASEADLNEMTKIIRRLQAAKSPGMTEKNARRLKPFHDPAMVERLLALPALMEREARKLTSRLKAARLMQMALAVDLLLVTLMRASNLTGLDLERHFVGGGDGQWIRIPGEEVKTRRPLEFPLPKRTRALLDIYLRDYRPLLVTTPTTALFPGQKGGGRQSGGFGQQISRAIKHGIGLTINPHLFRHIAAKLYLDGHPGAYEVVRRMLGHSSLSVTTEFYTGLETESAFRQYHNDVLGRNDGAGVGL